MNRSFPQPAAGRRGGHSPRRPWITPSRSAGGHPADEGAGILEGIVPNPPIGAMGWPTLRPPVPVPGRLEGKVPPEDSGAPLLAPVLQLALGHKLAEPSLAVSALG